MRVLVAVGWSLCLKLSGANSVAILDLGQSFLSLKALEYGNLWNIVASDARGEASGSGAEAQFP